MSLDKITFNDIPYNPAILKGCIERELYQRNEVRFKIDESCVDRTKKYFRDDHSLKDEFKDYDISIAVELSEPIINSRKINSTYFIIIIRRK